MWMAERDACDSCKTCEYFLHEYWNCQGDDTTCPEYMAKFIPASKNEIRRERDE